jgi:hypothetical protein
LDNATMVEITDTNLVVSCRFYRLITPALPNP